MAYSELIKSFNKIRGYMREFYVYGFKSRGQYTGKSARSYDDERRRMESWLGGYMDFRRTPDGKNVFISIDSRVTRRNPLYAAWKTKSFTDGDITLHFIIFDILHSPDIALPLADITARIDEYLSAFDEPRLFDDSTVRKKLAEYAAEGVIETEKRGRTLYYRRAADCGMLSADALDFFSEAAPCGVVGSYLLDKLGVHDGCFAFKHHYMTAALDSEILCTLFCAMHEKRSVTIENLNRLRDSTIREEVVPLRIYISARSGRQYLMAYVPRGGRITSFRIDNMLSAKPGMYRPDFDALRARLDEMSGHLWGASTHGRSGGLEHVEFTVTCADDEQYIHRRLEREKRCGTVERIDRNTSRFSADVLDATEMVPWIRTFICRITALSFSNKELERRFLGDIERMYSLYGIDDGEGDAQ